MASFCTGGPVPRDAPETQDFASLQVPIRAHRRFSGTNWLCLYTELFPPDASDFTVDVLPDWLCFAGPPAAAASCLLPEMPPEDTPKRDERARSSFAAHASQGDEIDDPTSRTTDTSNPPGLARTTLCPHATTRYSIVLELYKRPYSLSSKIRGILPLTNIPLGFHATDSRLAQGGRTTEPPHVNSSHTGGSSGTATRRRSCPAQAGFAYCLPSPGTLSWDPWPAQEP